jgi:succinate dehydrogenase / fumarate reductase, iron-sulfur subunit
MKLEFSIYRYNPDVDDAPHMQDYSLEAEEGRDMMLLDALILLKEKDPSLSFRRSCREGVCGSDGINMNGKNGLACITPISSLRKGNNKIVIRPLPGLAGGARLWWWIWGSSTPSTKRSSRTCSTTARTRRRVNTCRSPEQRAKLDGLVRVHSVRLLLDVVPVLLVEPGQVHRPGGVAGGIPLPD